MASLSDIQAATIAAMKSGDKTRANYLRMLTSTAKSVAKDDGNREPTDADVITAGQRLIKQTTETREHAEKRGDDLSPFDTEIAIYKEFLPQKMERAELTTVIEGLIAESGGGKAAKGFVMKELRNRHFGNYDPKEASDLVSEKLA